MSASRSSLTARLKKLEAAQVRAEAMPSKTRLDARPMAELLGTTWVSVRDWCDEIPKLESSGAVVRGGNGIKWQFEPKRTIKILIAHFRASLASQAKKSRQITSAVGVTLSDGDEAGSMSEIKDQVAMTISLVGMAEKQGVYVHAQKARDFIAGYNQALVDDILGVKTQVDPNGNLAPHIRAEIDKYLRSVATRAHGRAKRFIEENREGLFEV